VGQRVLGRTGRRIGIVGLGAWQIGADWGPVSDADALATLHAAGNVRPLGADALACVRGVYDTRIRPLVHDRW